MNRILPALSIVLIGGCGGPAHPAAPRELYNSLLNVRSLAFSPNSQVLYGGRSLGSGESQADLLIWDAGTTKEVHAHQDAIVGLGFSGDKMVSASADGTLKLWTPGQAEADKSMVSSRWYAAMGNASSGTVAVLHGGGRSTFQPKRAEIELWDIAKGEKIRTFTTPNAQNLTTSQDGGLLATRYDQPVIRLWHEDGSSAGEIASPATAICLSPDGKTLASGGPDGAVQLWDSASGKLRRELPRLSQRVTAIAFSPDGSQLAAGCEGKLALYGKDKQLWEKPVDSYASPSVLAFSPDGHKLASAGPSIVLLWPEI